NRFGADRLAGAGRPDEVERQRQAGGVALAEAPAIEDEVVLGDLRHRRLERLPRCRRQDDVVERPPRGHRIDDAAPDRAEEPGKGERCHASTVPRARRTIKWRVPGAAPIVAWQPAATRARGFIRAGYAARIQWAGRVVHKPGLCG